MDSLSDEISFDFTNDLLPIQETSSSTTIFDEDEDQRNSNHYSSKRQKTSSNSFEDKVTNGGFVFCKDTQNITLCIHCLLICYGWNKENDEPEKVHKELSPQCHFVRTKLEHVEISSHNHRSKPIHHDYFVDLIRLRSFQNLKNSEKFVSAGFFLDKNLAKCFYCDGSLPINSFRFDPLFEHVSNFPECHFARNKCGEYLWKEIRRANESEKSIRKRQENRISSLTNLFSQNFTNEHLNDNYELLSSQKSCFDLNNYSEELKRRCIERQFRTTGDGYTCVSELQKDCFIQQKQDEAKQQGKVPIVPKEELNRKYYQEQFPSVSFDQLSNNKNPEVFRCSSRIADKFNIEIQNYSIEQRKLAKQYKENPSITIVREISTQYATSELPNPVALINSGWMIAKSGRFTKCPCCLIEYHCWKPTDDPKLVHSTLSPNCLFILSNDPLHQNGVPMKFCNYFHLSNNDVATDRRQKYTGIVKLFKSPYYNRMRRLDTFDAFPDRRPSNADVLASNGFYFIEKIKALGCFSCSRIIIINQNSNDQQCENNLPIPHHFPECAYHLQMIDQSSCSTQSTKTELCKWCNEGELEYVAFPCRSMSFCEKCAKIRRTCPNCHVVVETYVRIYK